MIKSASNITYRGALKSCNYKCSYCPFSKRGLSLKEVEKDKKRWVDFLKKISTIHFENKCNILIAPYGEALIHDYYIEGIANLSKMPNIKYISCQTNLSFNINEFILKLKNRNVNLDKINLWCTYHPEMETIEEFTDKIIKLNKEISLSVGVVGNPLEFKAIKLLREHLPIEVYLWINAMDGLDRKYTDGEVEFLKSIDPMFDLELYNYTKDYSCKAGEKDFFIDSKGDIYPCNRHRKKIGNIYEEDKKITNVSCSKKNCNCYLSYSHLEDIKTLNFFNGKELVRVPKRLKLDAIFLDVDGTLINKHGILELKTKMAIEYLSKKTDIYLITELPYEYAIKKCSSIKKYIKGGIFSSGAHILDKENNYEQYNYFTTPKDIEKIKNAIVYTNEEKAYKIVLKGKLSETISINKEHLNIIKNGIRTTIVAKNVSKLNGLNTICSKLKLDKDRIMVVGNSYNDLEIINSYKNSVAVNNAIDILKENATYNLDVNQLVYML